MHQTFYIDIDEEISSVIDRLRKSMATENYFVVPKRALFMQSIVNLKLLKREADKLKKIVIIVTQDEFGINMAEKAGLVIKTSAEGLESVSDPEDEDYSVKKKNIDVTNEELDSEPFLENDKKTRLTVVGTEGFYDTNAPAKEIFNDQPKQRQIQVTSGAKSIQSRPETVLIPAGIKQDKFRNIPSTPLGQKQIVPRAQNMSTNPYRSRLDPGKEKTIEKLFKSNDIVLGATAQTQTRQIPVGQRSKKIIISFIVLCAVSFAGVLAYVFVPNAKIGVILETQKKKISTQISGFVNASQESADPTMQLKLVKKENSITISYDTTGALASSGKKAHGTVVIYNAFDNSPQTLVATTRIETQDGKIFRLTKDVVVPGAVGSGSDIKPGAISADVIADQAGDTYNVGATAFTITGFKGGPKFDKFSVKSMDPMIGGSSDGTSPKAVSEKDIEDARAKAESALREKILADISANADKGDKILDSAVKLVISQSAADVKPGDVRDTFNYKASGELAAMVFSEGDVQKIIQKLAQKDIDSKKYLEPKITDLNYTEAVVDFDAGTLSLKIEGVATLVPYLDADKLKREILGKNEDQLAGIAKQTFGIKNINIEIFPSFVSIIPKFPNRVTVDINSGE